MNRSAIRIGRLVFWLFGFTLSQSRALAQTQTDWLLKNADFQPILVEHIDNVIHKASQPSVSVLLFRPATDSLLVYLFSYMRLSMAWEHLPASYTTISDWPFLIYDGSETLIEDKDSWFEKVKAFVGPNLCNDIDHLKALRQRGSKELIVPCNFINDIYPEKLVFKKNKLVKREMVVRMPYYSSQPDN